MSKECCGSDKKIVDSINDQFDAHNINQSVFKITGMDCADEVAAIQNQLRHPKIAKVSANLMTSQVQVEHSADLDRAEITRMINRAGVRVIDGGGPKLTFFKENKKRVLLVGLSGVFVLIGLIYEWFFEPVVSSVSDVEKATAVAESFLTFPISFASAVSTFESIKFIIFLIATFLGASLIVPKAIRAIRQFSLDMNVLMVIAAMGAFLIKEYSEGAAVVFLFSLAEMLEAFSVSKARKAIQEVLSVTPRRVNLMIDSGLKEADVEAVKVGQKILVRPGDSIPLDGTILEGTSYVNQASLTGESQPVAKAVGDAVLAGTINENGALTVEVTHEFADTKIAQVIRLIEEAQSEKAPAQIFVDKFAKIYTPLVTLVALLVCVVPPLLFTGDWNTWFYRSLVFLVIACPCALVIATPVSVVSSLTALAKNGILVKGGVYLELLGKINVLAVDKTGTITEGKPKVISVKVLDESLKNEFLMAALTLESPSSHPLAQAVIDYCKAQNTQTQTATNYQVVPGQGVEASIGDHIYFAGNHKLAHELGVCNPEIESYLASLEVKAQSVVLVGHKPHANCEGKVLGIFGLADQPRQGVKEAVANLHSVGVKEIVILSGDNQRTVDAVAKMVGIDKAQGDLLPADKVNEIKKLLSAEGAVGEGMKGAVKTSSGIHSRASLPALPSNRYVAMIGDGINDAPALAQASLGIAMGGTGSDAAIETADITLMTDNLGHLSSAIEHGKKTLNVIHFNITFALATKAVFIVLGALGYSSLWLAVAADMGVSLFVIANSMRLLKFNGQENDKQNTHNHTIHNHSH